MEGRRFPFLKPGGCAALKSLDLASVVQTMDSTIHSINTFIISLNPQAGKRKRILRCGSYRGIFVILDTSCSVTKWLSVPEENSWFCYLFSPDFQFRDLRKINKDWARQMRMMNFCKLVFAVLLFFSPLLSCFSDTPFTTFFWSKTVYVLIYVTQKLKWKFDIRDSWLVTFLVREPCQRTHPPQPPANCAILCVLIRYPSGHWGPPCLLGISRVCPAKKSSLCDHIINPLLTEFVRPRWLGIALVLFCVLTSEICTILYRCTFCRRAKRSMKKVLSQRFLLSSFKTLYNAK